MENDILFRLTSIIMKKMGRPKIPPEEKKVVRLFAIEPSVSMSLNEKVKKYYQSKFVNLALKNKLKRIK